MKNPKIQHPSSREATSSKLKFGTIAPCLALGDGCFFGAWRLDFGAFY
jgi:hypothetical protein